MQPAESAEEHVEQSITVNKVVSFHYRLAEVGEDGERAGWREESHAGVPLAYLHGFHNVVVGLEKALEGKKVGDAIEITLQPDDAWISSPKFDTASSDQAFTVS